MSVRKRGQSWQASWTNRDGKRCTKTFRLKADALAFEREQRDLARKGELFDPQAAKQTVASLFEGWLATKGSLKPVTRIGYESVWKTVVAPRWGATRLQQVTYADVKTWLADCRSENGRRLGASRVRQAYQVLAMILDYAVESGFINRNPARGIEGSRKNHLPRVEVSDARNVLLRDELKALAIHCEPYGDLIMLMGTVGLRFNEAIALKGSDLDFDNNVITVERTFSDLNGHLVEQSPKSGLVREVPLPEALRSALLSRKLHAGPTGFLWVASNGAPLRHSNFSRRIWKPAVKAAGIEQRFTLHDLRHTAASWLVQSGCNISHLASMLGHQDSAVTLRRYTHLFSDDLQRIADLINGAESA